MDQNQKINQNEETNFPFQQIPTENQFHLYQNIRAKLIGQNEKEIIFFPDNGNVLITNERLCWFIDSVEDQNSLIEKQLHIDEQKINNQITISALQGKSFMFQYENLVSHGQQGDNFFCFLGSQEEEEMEIENEQEALTELEKQQSPSEIIDLGKGEYQIILDLQKLSKQSKEEFISIFTELATANVDMEEEGDDYLDEMITADNIDQDGNIIVQKKQNNDENDENDENDDNEDNDEDYEDIDDDEQEEDQKEKNEDNQFAKQNQKDKQ